MFITLSNVQHGEPIELNPVLDNREGGMEVALSEILYYPAWVNIAASLGNNMFHYGRDRREVKIPDGYWDVCALNKEVFTPLGLTLSLNPATGLISISGLTEYFDAGSVGRSLGFINLNPAAVNGRVTAEAFPRLSVHKELYIHLDGLSTYENRHNSLPSTLLRAIPVGQEECNGGRQVTFATPHFKRLEVGTHSSIGVSARAEDGSEVKLAYLSLVLEIRRNGCGRTWTSCP